MCVSESKRGLEKRPVYARLVHAVATIPILALECRVVRNIVADPDRGPRKIIYIHQGRIGFRLMNILEAIIRLPFALLPWQAVSELNIKRLALPGLSGQFIAMMDVGIF